MANDWMKWQGSGGVTNLPPVTSTAPSSSQGYHPVPTGGRPSSRGDRGGGFLNTLSKIADALFFPGAQAYNSTTGQWNPNMTKVGVASLAANRFMGGGGKLVRTAAARGWFGQGTAKGIRDEGISNAIGNQFARTTKAQQAWLAQHGGVEVNTVSMIPKHPTLKINDGTSDTSHGLVDSGRGVTQMPTVNVSPGFVSAVPPNAGGAKGAFTGGGFTGDAARAMMEGLSDASRFNTSFEFDQKTRSS